jgi:hypothetical protein
MSSEGSDPFYFMPMKFQCKYSGSVYEFTQEHDIKSMLTHPDYFPFKEQDDAVQVQEIKETTEEVKKTRNKQTRK